MLSMAIVQEFISPGGAHVTIHDDAYAGISEEERQRREAEFYKVVARIIRKAAIRAAEEKKEESSWQRN